MHMQDIWSGLVSPRHRLETLRGGAIMPLGTSGGRLEVLHGRVWLTRSGDLDDHVVDSGAELSVARELGGQEVHEPLVQPDEPGACARGTEREDRHQLPGW